MLAGWYAAAVNENENWSVASMGCCLLWHYKRDGVCFEDDAVFFKAIDPKTEKFSDRMYKFDQEYGRLWKQVAASNKLDALNYGGLYFLVGLFCCGLIFVREIWETLI